MNQIIDFLNRVREGIHAIFYYEDGKLNILGKILAIIIVLLIIKIVKILAVKLTDRLITEELKSKQPKKYLTISSVIANTFKYVLYFIAAIQILNIIGVKTQSIIATAGIGGMAIGFGAQSVIKDLISGMFLMMENQFEVGDHVVIDGIEGKVIEFGMKTTAIKGFDGALHTMNNGSIQIVTNKSRGPQRALVELKIPYIDDFDIVKKIVRKVSKEVEEESPFIIQAPYLLGITEMGATFMTITIIARTKPEQYFTVERQIREKMLREFKLADIKYLTEEEPTV